MFGYLYCDDDSAFPGRQAAIAEWALEGEDVDKLPPANIPVPIFDTYDDDYGASFRPANYVVFNFDYEDFWNPTLVSQINIFDDFEPDYSNITFYLNRVIVSLISEEEAPQIYPVPIQIGFLNSQFSDDDWSMWRDIRVGWITTEEDLGVPPIFQLFICRDEDMLFSTFGKSLYLPQDLSYEDWSEIVLFPPPALTNFERNEEVTWQHFLGYRLSQSTTEEEYTALPIIPTQFFDGEVEGSRQWSIFYGLGLPSHMEAEDDNSGYGWFLNPFVPPPLQPCPNAPSGPDGDIIISMFGGKMPLQVLFCRICKSGKPLLVRGDYAIWCQDCCAFVSKQDTVMMTVRAPGQFRGTF